MTSTSEEDRYEARRRPAVALIGYGCFLLIGWTGVLVPALIRPVEDSFAQTDAAVGGYFFVFAAFYGIGSFGGGLLTERLGRRAVLMTAGLLLGLGLIGQALSPNWLLFLAVGVPAGWAAGAIDGGINGLFLALYPRSRGGALNLLHLFFALGALTSPFLVGQLVSAGLSWQAVMIATGAVAVGLGLLLARTEMPSGQIRQAPIGGQSIVGPPGAESRPGAAWPFAALAIAIGCYVASEVGVSNWLVRFLSVAPLATATAGLSLFWGGLTLGRLLSSLVADRLNPVAFAAASVGLASVALVAAVLVPALPVSIGLFAVCGFFFGPVYPMIMVVGGTLYPHRLAAVSGGLGSAAVAGSVLYPPVMGLLSDRVGLGAGMIGAGILAAASGLALVGASLAARGGPALGRRA
ncbi:MAG TPA: MFS transporter [Candidatus Limnocylindria bacterium]|nr:MFS transporter [Candidatus Limnocylindria bacterium]